MTVQAGQHLSHYRLIERIGAGGMGVVWKALDAALDREVVIESLPEAVTRDQERRVFRWGYDVSRDGQRIVAGVTPGGEEDAALVVAQSGFAESSGR